MGETAVGFGSLLKASRGAVEFVDVPEFGFAVVAGAGAPGGTPFTQAVQALYAVSYGAHFLARQQRGQATKVMSLEALWWVDDPGQQAILAAVAQGRATMADTDRDHWRWQAMIMQPDPIDADMVRQRWRGHRPRNHPRGWNGSATSGGPRAGVRNCCTSAPTPAKGRPSSACTRPSLLAGTGPGVATTRFT